VDRIGVTADPATLTYSVVILLPNFKGKFLSGMSSTVTLHLNGLGKDFPSVPIHSVREGSATKKKYLWIVDAKSSTVKKIYIELGKIDSDEISVTKGLKKGDRIVTAGADRLRDGMKVRLN
jgi:RND family efflux transporter MFP subunit